MMIMEAKMKRRQARCIVHRSCRILRRLRPETFTHPPFEFPPAHVQIGDTIDVFSLLPQFLIFNHYNHPVMVRSDEKLRRKTVLIYILPLNVYHIPGGFCPDTLSLIAEFKERDFDDVEVVFVAVNRGPAYLDHCATNRFNDFFSKMHTWLAIPFSDQAASRRIQETWLPLHSPDKLKCRQTLDLPSWAMFDPSGTVLLTTPFVHSPLISSYGIAELVPRAHDVLPAIIQHRRRCDHVGGVIMDHLWSRAWNYIDRITKFDETLLGSPRPKFLLSKDGTKVSFSSLEDKVVGLYFCNRSSSKPSCMESIKKTYAEAIALGYDFEIVQINFNYTFHVHRPSTESENVPWLTLPYMHSCCKRLIRLFKCYNRDCNNSRLLFNCHDEGDRLVIINPHEPRAMGIRYDRHGASIIDTLGVHAYPFTRFRLVEMERARKRQELRLQLIFSLGGTPLLRRRGKSFEQVPLSQLSGRWVMLIFATHRALKSRSCKFITRLQTSYLQQEDNDDAFEVVYISTDKDEAGFDACTAETPWLVTPYSWEFAHKWRDMIFRIDDDRHPSKGSAVGFDTCGEFVKKVDCLESLNRSVRERIEDTILGQRCSSESKPCSSHSSERSELYDVMYRCGLTGIIDFRIDLLERL